MNYKSVIKLSIDLKQLRYTLREFQQIPTILQEFQQQITNQILGLFMNFEMVKNDLNYSCQNMKSRITEMETERENMMRSHEQFLTATINQKDTQIAQLKKKIQNVERQLEVRQKTDLLTSMRNQDNHKEVEQLNKKITELLQVIQSSNSETHSLRQQLILKSDILNRLQDTIEDRQRLVDQLRNCQQKITGITRQLQLHRLENWQLRRENSELREDLKAKNIPRIDITLACLEEEPKLMQKPYIGKQTPVKCKRIKENHNYVQIPTNDKTQSNIKLKFKSSQQIPTCDMQKMRTNPDEQLTEAPTQRQELTGRLSTNRSNRSQLFESFLSSLKRSN